MVQLLEVILLEIREKPRRPDRVLRNLKVMNVLIPVLANISSGRRAGGRHGAYYKVKVLPCDHVI